MEHAITGADVLDYIDAHGLKRLDACWLLGITPWRFGKIVKGHEQLPLHNPSIGVLLRLIDEWPEQSSLPKYPSLLEAYERVRDIDPRISKRVFGMALGCHPSWASAERMNQQNYSSPVVDRLLLLLWRRLDAAADDEQAKAVIQQWLSAALNEWRGRDDDRLDFIDG